MTRYLYTRVSTKDQDTSNQMLVCRDAGFDVLEEHLVQEKISGGVPAFERPLFSELSKKMVKGDELIVTKLDRLGRNSIDVLNTIKEMAGRGIKVRALNLGDLDITSSVGEMIVTVIAAVAQMERDLIKERTAEGIKRKRKDNEDKGLPKGHGFGRPKNWGLIIKVFQLHKENYKGNKIAAELGISAAQVSKILKNENLEEALAGYSINPTSGTKKKPTVDDYIEDK